MASLDHIMGENPPTARARLHLHYGEIPGIDGLRAICVGLVLVSHYGFEHVVPGGLGVTIFFFVSGFLITTLLLRERARTGDIAVGRFYLRRLLRLHPELLAFILLTGFVLYHKQAPAMDVAAGLLYFTNYYQTLGTPAFPDLTFRYPHLWSLAVEEHYYLTYPLLFAWLMRRGPGTWNVLIGICLAALMLRQVYWQLGVSGAYLYQATETRIDSIAYGCLAALLLWHRGDRLSLLLSRRGGWWPLALGLGLLVLSLAIRAPWFRDVLRYAVQGLALIALFVGLQASPWGGLLNPWLDAAPLRWIGRLSYAAYLWHMDVRFLIEAHVDLVALGSTLPGKLAVAAILASATFAIASLSQLLVYRSFLGLRRRFGSHA